MMEFCHSKTTQIIKVINSVKELILVLLSSKIQHRASPKTAQYKLRRSGISQYANITKSNTIFRQSSRTMLCATPLVDPKVPSPNPNPSDSITPYSNNDLILVSFFVKQVLEFE